MLIDSIDRERLPEAQYPFKIGDEWLTIDGRGTDELIREFSRLVGDGNAITLRRGAANALTRRDQAVHPRAHLVPDESAITVKLSNGETGAYQARWEKEGVPVTSIPTSPEVRTTRAFSIENDSEQTCPAQAS